MVKINLRLQGTVGQLAGQELQRQRLLPKPREMLIVSGLRHLPSMGTRSRAGM
jgi:hypothetical protein